MKKTMYQKRYLILGLLGVIAITGLGSWYLNLKTVSNNNFSKKEEVWQIVKIKTAQDFASIKLPAKVKSNQFAIISPRRTGIIQDLLVDIGDEIEKGQTIGSMLPEGVEGQGSAAIAEASARLQKAKAELANTKGVAVDAVSVATKQWKETSLQSKTQETLDQETQKQLAEKKSEAVLVATQAWENTKLALFGTGSNFSSRDIRGNFSNSNQKNQVKNLANEIQQMEESGRWNNPDKIVEHLSHLENFLVQAETLYKNARGGSVITDSEISHNLNTIQSQQLRLSQVKQAILVLEEKSIHFSSVQAEKEAGSDRSKEVLDLVQSQQNLTTTQAEKNVEVALAGYNAALVKAGHQFITSPFGGVITARMAEVGQAVTTNTPLFYLEGADTARSQESLYEIHFGLPESLKKKVSIGDLVTLKSMEGESFTGQVFRLSNQINLETNSIMATAIVFEPSSKETSLMEETKPSEELQHGQSLFVYVNTAESHIFTVPTLALKKRSNNYFLWTMADKQPLQIQVEVAAEDGEFSQVFSRDLKAGDSIISNPSVSLFKKSE